MLGAPEALPWPPPSTQVTRPFNGRCPGSPARALPGGPFALFCSKMSSSKKRRLPSQAGILDCTPQQKLDAIVDLKVFNSGSRQYPTLGALARSHGVARKTLRRWEKEYDAHGISGLESKKHGNQNASKFTPTKKQKVVALYTKERSATSRELLEELKDTGIKAVATAWRYRYKMGYKARKRRKKTLLNPEHLKSRLRYAETWKDDNFEDCCMTDEKWFFLTPQSTQVEYWRDEELEDGDKPILDFVESIKHPTKIMFTAFVVRPTFNKRTKKFTHDGKIGLWRSGATIKVAKKKSKNHERGDEYYIDETVDHEAYTALVKGTGFPNLRQYMRNKKKKRCVFQEDNASPHKKARPGLQKIAKKGQIKIDYREQPARSPDLNVLDLMIWRVLEAAVNKKRPKTKEDLVEACVEAWENMSPTKIETAFRLLKYVMQKIREKGGGNNFKIPHAGIRKELKAEGYPDVE